MQARHSCRSCDRPERFYLEFGQKYRIKLLQSRRETVWCNALNGKNGKKGFNDIYMR
jgi:hypothetical protein